MKLLGSESSALLLDLHNVRGACFVEGGWRPAERCSWLLTRGSRRNHRVPSTAALGLLSRFPAAVWWLANDDIPEASLGQAVRVQ